MDQPAYGDDLAYIHDTGFGGYAEGAAPSVLGLLHRGGIDRGRVVDLGCGSGIWAARLLEAGYDVTGVDISPAMIALARRRAPRGEFHAASFVQFPLPRCRAITALGEALCYLFDGSNGPDALRRLFERCYDALAPDGMLIFDVASTGLDRHRPPTFREGDDWACLVRFECDDAGARLLRHITTFRRDGELFRRGQETHRVQLYDPQVVGAWLSQTGFAVETTQAFGTFPLLPGRVGFIATRPAEHS
jgi:SAM-dependent methyltransferase